MTSTSNARRVYAACNVAVDAVRVLDAELRAVEKRNAELEAENAEYRAALLDSGIKLGSAVAEVARLRALCWCSACTDRPEAGLKTTTLSQMILCPECGNKRCPRATHHDNACTRSNAPGQAGSSYE